MSHLIGKRDEQIKKIILTLQVRSQTNGTISPMPA